MKIRPLDILDLPVIARYRHQALSLDTTRLVTRGHPMGTGGFLSYFNPSRHIYSVVAQEEGITLIGSVIHTNGDTFAKLAYLAPAPELTHSGFPALIEDLVTEAGKWGAFHVLAEVNENSEGIATLQKAGFSIYTSQRIWDVTHLSPDTLAERWTRARPIDLTAIQSLYHHIIPPLLQPMEQIPKKRVSGLISVGDMKAYVNLVRGSRGIMLTPFIHPETADVSERLASLLSHLPGRDNRPVFICVRSYQAWLEPLLEDLGGKASLPQAVMVKHLTRLVKDEQAVNAAEKVWATPATSLTPVSKYAQ